MDKSEIRRQRRGTKRVETEETGRFPQRTRRSQRRDHRRSIDGQSSRPVVFTLFVRS